MCITDLLSLPFFYFKLPVLLFLAVNMQLFLRLFSPHLISTLGMHAQIQELQHMASCTLSLSLHLSPIFLFFFYPSLCPHATHLTFIFHFPSYFLSLSLTVHSPVWSVSSCAGTDGGATATSLEHIAYYFMQEAGFICCSLAFRSFLISV